MACLSLSLPTLAAPVHAWDQKLLHGDQCCQFIFAHECCWTTWFLNKPQLVLHFVCIWTGWDWDGVGRFECGFCLTVFVVFFLIWSKEAETCLKVFQLPIFLFDITCPSILCQPPPKENRKLSLSVSEATSCLNQKITENTQFLLSRQGGTGELIPLVFSCFCGLQKQTTHLKIVSNLVQIPVLGYCNLLDCRGT